MRLQFVPFKIGSLWSNTAIPVLLTLFLAVEEVFFWDVFQNPRRSCLDFFQLSKNDVIWGGFWVRGIERNLTEPSQDCTVGGEALWYYFEPTIPI